MRRELKRIVTGAILALLLAPAVPAGAVVLDDENTLVIQLQDGTTVKLYAEAGSTSAVRTHRFYYLPVGLRVAARPDGTPEFLFLKFTTEKASGPGAVSGAVMHFLMEWGLTPKQEQELAAKLKEKFGDAELAGAVPVDVEGDGSFQIVSATLSDKGLTSAVVQTGRAPLVGGRAAAAARLGPEGAQLLAATFEKARSITDLSIALNYTYQTLMPAARGHIVFDWSRLQKEFKELSAEYSQRGSRGGGGSLLGILFGSSSSGSRSYPTSEMRKEYDFLIEKKVITLDFDEMIADERVAKIRDAFFQFFVNNMAEPVKNDPPPPASDKEKDSSPDARFGNRYQYKQTAIKNAFARGIQTFDLNYRLAVRRPFQIVGNLASWYDAVKSNPRCVTAINLNDPFFQHRDINFIVDLDAKDIFEQAVNYVTVNVRKRRSSGNPFSDRVTIDSKFLKEKGVAAALTYARGEDKDPDAYEYQSQWSLRGGKVYPENPPWIKGTWEGVTLSPPVAMRTIEVEGDLAAMKTSDITRITVQVHYPRFGEEIEENIQISPAKNEPLVSRRIIMDRDARGYAYRLVVNHKTEGKLVLPWSARVGDDYIYATIPEELLKEGSSLKEEAKKAGESTADSSKERVLDKFKDLLGGRPRS